MHTQRSAASAHLVAGCMWVQVVIWHVESGAELMSLTTAIESNPRYCIFSHDDTKLAVTESNGTVMVWNVVAGCQWYVEPICHSSKAANHPACTPRTRSRCFPRCPETSSP